MNSYSSTKKLKLISRALLFITQVSISIICDASNSDGCSNSRKIADIYTEEKISEYYNSENFKSIISCLENIDWEKSSSEIKLLAAYANAAFETKMPISGDNNNNSVLAFVEGYFELRKGYTERSRRAFEALIHEQNSINFGYLGLLRQAEFTENYLTMSVILERLHADIRRGVNVSPWLIAYHELYYQQSARNYEEVRKLIERNNTEKVLKESDLLLSRVSSYIHDNQLEAAREYLKSREEEQPNNISIARYEAKILSLEKGDVVARNFLEEKMKKNPVFGKSNLMKESLFRYGHEPNDLLALQYEAIKSHPDDAYLKLDFAIAALDAGNREQLAKALLAIKTSKQSLEDFQRYNLLVAKLELVTNPNFRLDDKPPNDIKLHQYLDKARAMSPMDFSTLLFSYHVAKREKRWSDAVSILKTILIDDPNEVHTLDALFRLYKYIGHEEEAKVIATKIQNSGRFIPLDTQKELGLIDPVLSAD